MYSQLNLERLFQLIGRMPHQEYRREDLYEFIQTPVSVWPNQVFNFSASKDQIDGELAHLEELVRQGTIPAQLMLHPSQSHEWVIDHLKNRSYPSQMWTAMVHKLKEAVPQPNALGLQIRQIEHKRELELWLEIVETELMGNQPLDAGIFNRLMKDKSCYFFLGYANDFPVSTAFLFTHENSAGIYLVSTLKSHRKRGIGKVVTQQCLWKAQALECQRVDIQATTPGKKVYKSLGFVSQG
ncbi:MAG: GNAT family N-acetyltransferase, partial [Bacteroidota bacterium]